MITLVFDIDGVLVAEDVAGAYDDYRSYLRNLPKSWQTYHQIHVITINYQNKKYHHLLLPGVVEMLEYFSIHLKEKVRIVFFSAGLKERNEPFCKALMQMVAEKAKVDFDSLDYTVYSRHHCEKLPDKSELQPRANNNPHIPENCHAWCESDRKKVLSKFFADISNVILIDDQYSSVIHGETANHLKAIYCNKFSGLDFRLFQEKGLTPKQQSIKNQDFLQDLVFYQVNQSYYITGLLLAMIERSEKLKITASVALEALQLCPHTNKYQQALYDLPIFHRYASHYFEHGFLVLQKLNASLEFFVPYPYFALDALRKHECYVMIDANLRQATGNRYPNYIYDKIHDYHDNANIESPRLTKGFFSQGKRMEHDEDVSLCSAHI